MGKEGRVEVGEQKEDKEKQIYSEDLVENFHFAPDFRQVLSMS